MLLHTCGLGSSLGAEGPVGIALAGQGLPGSSLLGVRGSRVILFCLGVLRDGLMD